MPVSAPSADFAADVARGLSGHPKRLPPKYFYDALGSTLFEAICRLPWYTITRAEHRLLERHADAIAATVHASAPGDAVTVIELGCGSGEKLMRIGRALARRGARADVHLIDISAQALRKARRRIERCGPATDEPRHTQRFTVSAHRAPYVEGLELARLAGRQPGPALALFLGSNIGNFEAPEAAALIAAIRAALEPGDFFLLGADLVKPASELLLAYDDPLGVTAAFNKNLLVRMNRELGATFDLDAFAHDVRWNAAASRVEMHLTARTRQTVPIQAVSLTVEFAAGESIWTESSCKYEPAQLSGMGHAAGFSTVERWIDDTSHFALTLFSARTP